MIIGLSGYAQTGKDTVAQHLVEKYGFVRIAFADAIREALYKLNPILSDYPGLPGIRLAWAVDHSGWESVKQDSKECRRMLQRFGTEVGRDLWGSDFWVNIAMAKTNGIGNVVITDVRFPNEYDAIVNGGGKVWRVEKPGVSAVNAHASETALDGHTFDHTIVNMGSKDDLYAAVDYFIQH